MTDNIVDRMRNVNLFSDGSPVMDGIYVTVSLDRHPFQICRHEGIGSKGKHHMGGIDRN